MAFLLLAHMNICAQVFHRGIRQSFVWIHYADEVLFWLMSNNGFIIIYYENRADKLHKHK